MSARTSCLVNYFQIEVACVSKRDEHERETQYKGLLINSQKIKVADIPYPVPLLTLVLEGKNKDAVKKIATKLGTVLSCFKIDETDYYERREKVEQRFLKNQHLPEVRVESSGVTIDANLNVTVKRGQNIVVL